jgi:hypothetical protein
VYVSRFELDFLHGQEKTSAEKEIFRQEKTNPEKISSQQEGDGEEEAHEEGCYREICGAQAICGKEEISR